MHHTRCKDHFGFRFTRTMLRASTCTSLQTADSFLSHLLTHWLCVVAVLAWNFLGAHGPMASLKRGSGAEPSAGSRGRAPGQGVWGGEAPWSWNIFSFWTFTGSHKFVHFSKIWKRKKSQIFMLSYCKNEV